MGHHLLNGVKCVREARGLTNALIIWLWTGQGKECAGWEVMTRHWANVINYHWGGLPRRQGLVSPRLLRSQTSFHLSKPSLGIWTEEKNQSSIISPRSRSQTRKEEKCLRPVTSSSPSTVRRPGVSLALRDLFIIAVKLDASWSPQSYTLLWRDGGWLGLRVGAAFLKSPHLEPSATITKEVDVILRMEGGAKVKMMRWLDGSSASSERGKNQ